MLRYLFSALAILSVITGLGILVAPEALGATFWSAGATPVAVALARLLGAVMLPLGYVLWVAATADPSPLRLALTRASAVTPVLSGVVVVLALSAGVITPAVGIFNLVVNAIFIVGFGYYGFVRTQSTG